MGHKIHVFAWISGNTVTVESNFSGNRPLIDGTITVFDNESKAILLQGTGDKKGLFSFEIPPIAREKAMELLIVVNGSEGHRSQWLVPAEEYRSDQLPVEIVATTATTTTKPPANDELKQIIQEILTQELAPIKRSLAAAENKKPGFRDIMGGIGYILGLAGLVSWLKNRPAKKQ